MTQLRGNHFDVSHEEVNKKEDVVIINTCGFIDKAKEESVNTILEYSELKKAGEISELYVMGCLSERYKEDLEVEIPNVDRYYGTTDLPSIIKELGGEYKYELLGERVTTTPQHFAYLKIAEGCNRTCSFCAIPLMRGKHKSQTIDDLVIAAKNHARNGVKELILISQELTYYGLDIYKKRNLVELLKRLADIEEIEWIRLHYAYPSKFPRDILDFMAAEPKICSYLDMPLQHISNRVLQSMRRQITKEETLDLIKYAQDTVPDLTLRTTMLVGHPGETNEDFDELCQFVNDGHFDRLGVFQYSHEENTIAYEMEDDIPASLKQMRAETLMDIQQDISLSKNQKKIGKIEKVLIESKENEFFRGRTQGDSPEVDNEVLVTAEYLRAGDFYDVEITDATDYDLYGKVKN